MRHLSIHTITLWEWYIHCYEHKGTMNEARCTIVINKLYETCNKMFLSRVKSSYKQGNIFCDSWHYKASFCICNIFNYIYIILNPWSTMSIMAKWKEQNDKWLHSQTQDGWLLKKKKKNVNVNMGDHTDTLLLLFGYLGFSMFSITVPLYIWPMVTMVIYT
jgi:hypothetical protein